MMRLTRPSLRGAGASSTSRDFGDACDRRDIISDCMRRLKPLKRVTDPLVELLEVPQTFGYVCMHLFTYPFFNATPERLAFFYRHAKILFLCMHAPTENLPADLLACVCVVLVHQKLTIQRGE